VGRGEVSFLRLAELLLERLRAVLPARMSMRIATAAEVTEMNASNARFAPGFPAYHHARGVVIVSFDGDPGRRVIHVGPFGAELELHSWMVSDALSGIADEASEETHDYYESDAEIEDGAIRIWFGLVPPGSPEGPWREVVPELAPIPLSTVCAAETAARGTCARATRGCPGLRR
jgi:hypothetical protein